MKKRQRPALDFSDFQVTDREECGILIGRINRGVREVERIVKVPNASPTPKDNYAILMNDLKHVEKCLGDGEIVIGFFHTHTALHGIRPSANDRAGAEVFPGFLNLIYKPSTGETVWYASPDKRNSIKS